MFSIAMSLIQRSTQLTVLLLLKVLEWCINRVRDYEIGMKSRFIGVIEFMYNYGKKQSTEGYVGCFS